MHGKFKLRYYSKSSRAFQELCMLMSRRRNFRDRSIEQIDFNHECKTCTGIWSSYSITTWCNLSDLYFLSSLGLGLISCLLKYLEERYSVYQGQGNISLNPSSKWLSYFLSISLVFTTLWLLLSYYLKVQLNS